MTAEELWELARKEAEETAKKVIDAETQPDSLDVENYAIYWLLRARLNDMDIPPEIAIPAASHAVEAAESALATFLEGVILRYNLFSKFDKWQ